MSISINDFVNITIVSQPADIKPFNVNTICILTEEQPIRNINEEFYKYTDANQVVLDFGTNAKITNIVKSIYLQPLNIQDGDGSVIVYPLKGITVATNTFALSKTIDDPLITQLKSIKNGSILIEIDNQKFSGIDMNFSDITNIDDIVDILNKRFPILDISKDNNQIKISSSSFGANTTLSVKAQAVGTDISSILSFKITKGSDSKKIDPNVIIPKLKEKTQVIMPVFGLEPNIIKSFLKAIISQNQEMFYFLNGIDGVDAYAKQTAIGTNDIRLFAVPSKKEDTQSLIGAFIGSYLSTNYRKNNGYKTLQFTELNGVSIPLTNEEDKRFLETWGFDTYVGINNGSSLVSSVISNNVLKQYDETTDTKEYGLTWNQSHVLHFLRIEFQTNLFNTLRDNQGIKYTQDQLSIVNNAIETVCINAKINGSIVSGIKWEGTLPFQSDSDIFHDNILSNGYYVQPVTIENNANKDARQNAYLVNCNVAVVIGSFAKKIFLSITTQN